MTRPCCPRQIGFVPGVTYFKPAGVPLRDLAEVVVTLDELEALRLADLEGLYQEEAAKRMQVSRPTFARIVEAARRKVADALIGGKALRLEGGPVIGPAAGAPPPGAPGGGRGRCGRGRGRGWCGGGRNLGEMGNEDRGDREE
jgi:predicted DNA-binding protein (UPF0251 family)